MEKEKIIIKENARYAFFPKKENNGNVLFIGNLCNAFGAVSNGKHKGGNLAYNNLDIVFDALKDKNDVYFITPKYVDDNINAVENALVRKGWLTAKDTKHIYRATDYKTIDWLLENDMKFDYIIQNPPYKGSLHLDFLEKGLDLLKEDGKMVIIEPATWLINVRKNGKAKKYDEIKKRIEGHVESVAIENLNKDFSTSTHVPFATTTIDMSKTFSTVKFVCCGKEKEVESIYDCNLIGNYATIWGILDKCRKYGDMMENHIWDEKSNDGNYITFMDICASPSNKNASSNATPESNTWFTESKNGDFFVSYLGVSLHPKYEISNEPQYAFKACGNSAANKNYSDKYSTQLYGTRQELENWKHFIFNNKLPLFLNIVLTIDQHNNSKPYLPWLVDKQYTDEEINEMFGFTDEEIKLIYFTIKKYERNSPWFKRYMCGPDSVTDDEVNNFIEKISE